MTFWKQWTGLDDAEVARFRHAEMTAGPFAIARTEQQPKPKQKPSFADLDVEAIYRQWNAPRPRAQQKD